MKIGDSVTLLDEPGIVLHIEAGPVIWFLSWSGIYFCKHGELKYAEPECREG